MMSPPHVPQTSNTKKLTRFLPSSLTRQGAPWAITPNEVRQVISRVKGLLPWVLRDGEGGAPGEGYGGAGQGQGVEARLWEMDLPAFIERCLSSSINDLQALPFINDLFKVRRSVRWPKAYPRFWISFVYAGRS